jgi:TCP-1/cpn60 chaperonin family
MLDLRPYVKIKTISGGSLDDCAYVSGILFRKTPRHRAMCREVIRPRIMVLSGGIDFHSTRSTEQQYRMASLETLFEQEDTYLEILVSKILKHKPNVLFVGRGVSGKGQDLLVKAGVVVVQYVKPGLLHRIARQTGAAIISSPDHISVMGGSGGGASSGDGSTSSSSNVVIGRCHRFRLVTFRDNEVWMDLEDDDTSLAGKEDKAPEPADSSASEQQRKPGVDSKSRGRRSIRAVLNDPKLSNQERQAALAAVKLGEKAMEGSAAMNMGLASRFVARNYILIEGCPKNLVRLSSLGFRLAGLGSHQSIMLAIGLHGGAPRIASNRSEASKNGFPFLGEHGVQPQARDSVLPRALSAGPT